MSAAKQSRTGGASISAYFSQQEFQRGWQSFLAGEPFDYKTNTRQYEEGRLAASESGMPRPAPAGRRTKEMMAVYAAIPAMRKQWATEQALGREEAKAKAALRLRLMHYAKQKAAT